MNIKLAPQVQEGLRNGHPIVALESSVISQGLTYPSNLEAHRRCEEAIRKEGAIPAAVAVLRGALCIGLCQEEVEQLAEDRPDKLSCSDLAMAMAGNRDGATTVSATMAAAHLAGIPIMATGGLGGVHRDYHETFDLSADLHELSRTPVAVVCSGVKSVLDVARTLEMLESLGVPTVGYGTDEFPAFFTHRTGLRLVSQVDNGDEAARLLRMQRCVLKRNTGVVFACPPENPMDPVEVEEAARKAINQAKAACIQGKELTPFLLKRLEIISAGRTQEVNIGLLENNARIAARIAVSYSRIIKEGTP